MNTAFRRFNRKVTAESVLKSLGLAAVIGFSTVFVVALICWLTGFKYAVALSLSVGAAVIAVTAPLFYFRKFRPTAKKIAAKVDALGLEERLITMTELENDTSYIAMRQRQDALEKLAYVNEKYLKMRFSKRAVAAFSVAVVFGISMLTVSGLSAAGLIPGLNDIFDTVNAETLVAVDYDVEGEGMIDGDINQLLLVGEDASVVIAVADDGWMFVGWDDGYEDPVRCDKNVTEDQLHIAIFEQLGGNGKGNGDGNPDGEPGEESENGEEGEKGDSSNDSAQQDQQDSSDPGDPEDQNQDQNSDANPDLSDEEGDGAGGQYKDNNKILDNNTFYEDVLDQFVDLAKDQMENNDDLTDEDREMIDNYFGTI